VLTFFVQLFVSIWIVRFPRPHGVSHPVHLDRIRRGTMCK
jgi:hypothetical protein